MLYQCSYCVNEIIIASWFSRIKIKIYKNFHLLMCSSVASKFRLFYFILYSSLFICSIIVVEMMSEKCKLWEHEDNVDRFLSQ